MLTPKVLGRAKHFSFFLNLCPFIISLIDYFFLAVKFLAMIRRLIYTTDIMTILSKLFFFSNLLIQYLTILFSSFSDDVPLVPLEFLSDSPLTAADLCSDFTLGLHENEPDSWTPLVGKEISRKLKEKEIKRQEHIYEFILTEKHHCMTLLVMQKVTMLELFKTLDVNCSV